jgi:hypothetical protein
MAGLVPAIALNFGDAPDGPNTPRIGRSLAERPRARHFSRDTGRIAAGL